MRAVVVLVILAAACGAPAAAGPPSAPVSAEATVADEALLTMDVRELI